LKYNFYKITIPGLFMSFSRKLNKKLPNPTSVPADKVLIFAYHWEEAEFFRFADCYVMRQWTKKHGWKLMVNCKNRLPDWDDLAHARYSLVPNRLFMAAVAPSVESWDAFKANGFFVFEIPNEEEMLAYLAHHGGWKKPETYPYLRQINWKKMPPIQPASVPDGYEFFSLFKPTTRFYSIGGRGQIQVDWEPDKGWSLHMTMRRRYPTWEEMAYARTCLIPPAAHMSLLMPPDDKYINASPYNLILTQTLGLDEIERNFERGKL